MLVTLMRLTLCFTVLLVVSCAPKPRSPAPLPAAATRPAAASSQPSPQDWFGVYATPVEISGFSGTTLCLQAGYQGSPQYRMRFYSDVISGDAIKQEELFGGFLTDGDALYLPRAFGFVREGVTSLMATVDRYTLVTINGHKVLLRDDALRAYRKEDKLYDYGILIKVDDRPDAIVDLEKVQHPSIRSLYADPSKPWKDPFVHGANGR
jgi:hypothetical protein